MNAEKRGLTIRQSPRRWAVSTTIDRGKSRMNSGANGDKVLVTGGNRIAWQPLTERMIAGRHAFALARPTGSKTEFLESARRRNRARRSDRSGSLQGRGYRVSHECFTSRPRSAIGAAGASSKPGASMPPESSAQAAAARESIASSISARPALTAIRPKARPRSMSRPRWDRTSGSSTITPGARSIASACYGNWPTPGLPLTVIRPNWLFGERDSTTVPRPVRRIESRTGARSWARAIIP